MKCPKCGIGDISPRDVTAKKYGKSYTFVAHSCSNYPSCQVRMTKEDYAVALAGGEFKLAPKKLWTKDKHTPYNPRQLVNANPRKRIPVMQMTIEQELAAAHVGSKLIIRIDADAGVGKTTWAKQVAARHPAVPGYNTAGIILAFAKRNAVELDEALPGLWVSSTVHSAGNRSAVAKYGVEGDNVNKRKTVDIIFAEYKMQGSDDDDGLSMSFISQVEKLVSMCKALAFDELVTDETIVEWANHYNRTLPENLGQALTMVREILKISRSADGIRKYGHDYDDMVWLPVINRLPVAQYPVVIVDEAQDSSRARMLLAIMMCTQTLIFVGDKSQAIFGFTCADTSSMDTFAQLAVERLGWDLKSFAVTINWRCPSLALDIVRHIHPSIKARPNAPLGFARKILHEHVMEEARPGDLILCRTNAPLIEMAYSLLKAGRAAVVLGRDVAERLEKLIVRYGRRDGNFLSTGELISNLNGWYSEGVDKLNNQNSRNKDRKIDELGQDYDCIVALCGIVDCGEDGYDTNDMIPGVEGVLNKIKMLFGETSDRKYDPAKVITLSTVHKMKGGQAARVFLLHAKAMHPHPMAQGEWELDQELNSLYVALTRVGDGSNNPDQGIYFVGVTMDEAVPVWLAEVAHLIEPYNPYASLTRN